MHRSGALPLFTGVGLLLVGCLLLTACTGPQHRAALAGLPHPTLIRVAAGGTVLITGLSTASSLSVTPADVLAVDGSTLTARRAGTAVLTIHNWFCLPIRSGVQPHSCTLARVLVT